MDEKEYFNELNLLVEKIADTFGIAPPEAAKAIESGELTIAMETDEHGRACLGLAYRDKTARLIADPASLH